MPAKCFDWKNALSRNPLFRDLEPAVIDRLVDDRVSTERTCEANEIILREGDLGNSIFVIGSGEVAVELLREHDRRIRVARLGAGEIFGEMALLENRPRSATVVALELTVVLEIDGPMFLKLMRAHHELEVHFLSKLSERLRRVMDEVLVVKFHDLSQKTDLLKADVDRELHIIRASVKTVEGMLETTKQRALEIGEHAERVLKDTARNQERVFQAIKIVGLVGAVAAIVLGGIGYNKVEDVLQSAETVAEAEGRVEDIKDDAERMEPLIKETETRIAYFREVLEPNFYKRFAVDLAFEKDIENGREQEASETLSAILKLKDPEISDYLFETILNGILINQGSRNVIKRVLRRNLDTLERFRNADRFLTYYLLLSAYVIDDDRVNYNEVRTKFKHYIGRYFGDPLKANFSTPLFEPRIFEEYFEASSGGVAFDLAPREEGADGGAPAVPADPEANRKRFVLERTKDIRDIWEQVR